MDTLQGTSMLDVNAALNGISSLRGVDYLAEIRQLMHETGTATGARRVEPRLGELASFYPLEFDANYSHVLALELCRTRDDMLSLWLQLHERFPQELKPLRYIVRWFYRAKRVDEACNFIEAVLPSVPKVADDLLEKGELYCELRKTERAQTYFTQFIERFPEDVRGRISYARRLKDWGNSFLALSVLEGINHSTVGSNASGQFIRELRDGMAVLAKRYDEDTLKSRDASGLALALAIEKYASRREEPPATNRLGKVSLITGSLAAGGAERQIARVGIRLTAAFRMERPLAGVVLTEPCHVVLKSLKSAEGYDFFLPAVRRNDVETREIDDFPTERIQDLALGDDEISTLLPILPKSALYGIQRMVNYFREEKIEVAFIWQDGAVLFAALAALIAGVPRIVVSVRGLPPSLRVHLFHPAYQDMYRALAVTPGVRFSSNSEAAVKAYTDWLKVDNLKFSIVHNGVLIPLLPVADGDVDLWEKFQLSNADATTTIGSVFRFDTDKRPSLWIDFAHAYLQRRPRTKIVLVGGGRMLKEAKEKAARLGIIDRVLFTGLSDNVGFWLKKMDAFVLLSRFEGLPNALIEAQLCGVPVVTTPAGGAADTVVEGITGCVLSTVEEVDMEECCDKVDNVLAFGQADPLALTRIRHIAEERFSTEAMVLRTVRLLAGNYEDGSLT
ncbi:glycosyltransferase [Mesorhizobium australicum]|uniref:glycosyltransferase n=1 Tax=Mesorhizobium australicum TaxID=536018 RepID=UPI00333D4D0E